MFVWLIFFQFCLKGSWFLLGEVCSNTEVGVAMGICTSIIKAGFLFYFRGMSIVAGLQQQRHIASLASPTHLFNSMELQP